MGTVMVGKARELRGSWGKSRWREPSLRSCGKGASGAGEGGGRGQTPWASDAAVSALGFVLRMMGIHWMDKSRITPSLTSILKSPSNSIKQRLKGLQMVPWEIQGQQKGTQDHEGFIRIPQALLGNARWHSVPPGQ